MYYVKKTQRKHKIQTCVFMLIKIMEKMLLHVNKDKKNVSSQLFFGGRVAYVHNGSLNFLFFCCWFTCQIFLNWGSPPAKCHPFMTPLKGTGLFCRHWGHCARVRNTQARSTGAGLGLLQDLWTARCVLNICTTDQFTDGDRKLRAARVQSARTVSGHFTWGILQKSRKLPLL